MHGDPFLTRAACSAFQTRFIERPLIPLAFRFRDGFALLLFFGEDIQLVALQSRQHVTRTLVVANQTVGGEPLLELLKAKGRESPHNFVVILPQGEGGEHGDADQRLAHTLELLHQGGLEAIGQVMDPDPFTAIQNALQFYPADEIVISTFPETRSGWLRSDLVKRVKESVSLPVEHVVVDAPTAAEVKA